ncbi:MAG: phospholipid carrier-dependent glycosyltransferase [Candidatus Thermoplasmatota archaeon]|nr:phospholipid carrier-dependent glycosyltransferase [Candidatus Thermoplasmatota archaeon]
MAVDDNDLEMEKTSAFLRFQDSIIHSRHSNMVLAAIILLIATIPRVFYISKGLLPNGVDEGIDIMAGRMYNFGYELYSQINTVQAPLMLTVYSIIEADPVIFRLFSTLSSLVVMAFVMWVGFRIGGRHVMVAAGAFAALDIMFLHEARLASLDMFCLFWVSMGVASLVKFRQSGEKRSLFLLGAMMAVASMVKLFGVLAAGAAGLILVYDWVSGWEAARRFGLDRFTPPKKAKVRIEHILLFSLSFTLIILFIMARYGVGEVIQGVLFNQLGRPISPFSTKLSFFGLFLLLNAGAIPFLPFGLRSLYRRPEGVILIISGVYLLWFIFQATTWIHHLIFLSPAISLTAGVGIINFTRWLSKKKYISRHPRATRRMLIYTEVGLILFAAVIGGGFSWLVKESGRSIDDRAADILMEITDENDFVISGDPLVPVKAYRPVPPNLVNVAVLQYPYITDDELNKTCIEFAVEAVVITYRIQEMEGFVDFVETNYRIKAIIEQEDHFLDPDVHEYRIYYLPIDASIRQHPDWGVGAMSF